MKSNFLEKVLVVQKRSQLCQEIVQAEATAR